MTHQQKTLAKEILSCLEVGNPREVNLSIPRHATTTPVLRRFVYDSACRGRTLPIVFRDNSHPTPFPLGSLEAGEATPLVTANLFVGLMSFRHPELDYLVDLYITRNRELAEQASQADEEALAFTRTTEFFEDPAFDRGCVVYACHTGLEPMVVGFYRGVVHTLQQRSKRGLPRNLAVVPLIFRGNTEEHSFTPASPGARLESYEQIEPWW